jgi:hypothetical protein
VRFAVTILILFCLLWIAGWLGGGMEMLIK